VDYEEVLESIEADAIFVLTEEDNHADPAVTFLEARSHVFCEKPITSILEDADRMIKTARRAGRWLFVGHILRLDPQVCRVEGEVEEGRFRDVGLPARKKAYKDR